MTNFSGAKFREAERNTGINLIVKAYDKSVSKDKDVEIDYRDTKFGNQTNPHLVNAKRFDKEGKLVLDDEV